MPAAARLASVGGAATAGLARDDTADGAPLHGSARSGADTVAARLTLVTLECTPVDIVMSVNDGHDGGYSPAVLRLQGQPRLRPLPPCALKGDNDCDRGPDRATRKRGVMTLAGKR